MIALSAWCSWRLRPGRYGAHAAAAALGAGILAGLALPAYRWVRVQH